MDLEKEKIYRAYLQARKMNLSEHIQKDLALKLKDSEQEEIVEEAVESFEEPQEEGLFSKWMDLLKSRKTRKEAFPFFKEHQKKLLEELAEIKDQRLLHDFYRYLNKSKNAHEILKLTLFGRLLSKSKNDDNVFYQITHYVESRQPDLSNEDIFYLCLFFSDPFSWISKKDTNYNRFSLWVLKYYKQIPSTAHVFSFFHRKKMEFQEPSFEIALWEPMTHVDMPEISSVAYFHLFLNSQTFSEKDLWESWIRFSSYEGGEEDMMALRDWALNLSWDPYIVGIHAKRSYLSVLAKKESLNLLNIRNFIEEFGVPKHEKVLCYLMDFIKDSQEEALELKMLQSLSKLRILSLTEMQRLASLAKNLEKKNLIDNVELLLYVRASKELSQKEFSQSRHRFHRSFVEETQILNHCLSDFSLEDRKFVSSYFYVSPWAHYFLEEKSRDFRSLRFWEGALDPLFRNLKRTYKKIFGDDLAPVLVHKSLFSKSLVAEVPTYYRNLPDSTWGKTLANASQYCAYNHMEGILKQLREGPRSLPSKKFKKWYRRTSKDMKLNWHQLHLASLKISDEKAKDLVRIFLLRFASLVSRDLSLCLWTLQGPGAPGAFHQEIESWIVQES